MLFVLNFKLSFATQGYQPNAIECKEKGTFVCGVCSCNPGFYGKQCECEGNKSDKSISVTDCKPDNQTTELCSGHGTCKCGVCDCDKRPHNPQELFYGTYCECDNFSCKRSSGQVCPKIKGIIESQNKILSSEDKVLMLII